MARAESNAGFQYLNRRYKSDCALRVLVCEVTQAWRTASRPYERARWRHATRNYESYSPAGGLVASSSVGLANVMPAED